MKKVFLLLTSALFGVATMATPWASVTETSGPQEVSLPYNVYGNGDSGTGTISFSWQGGNNPIVLAAVEEALGDDYDSWLMAAGQVFQLKVKGTCTADGTFKTGIIDESDRSKKPNEAESPIDNYFWKLSDFASPEVKVTAGEPFEQTFIYTIKALPPCGTTVGNLVFGFEMADFAAATAYNNGQAPSETPNKVKTVDFSFSEFELLYLGDLSDYTNPVALNNQGPADKVEDGYKYQAMEDQPDFTTAAKVGDYFNFNISGYATKDISTLMIALWDNSEKASPKPYATSLCAEGGDGMLSIAANIKANEPFSVKGSIPIVVPSNGEQNTFQVVYLAQSQSDVPQIILDLDQAEEYSIGADKGWGIPELAVEDVENVVFEGGVVYSSSIEVLNVAGQVVATAAGSFDTKSLEKGVYIIKTAEGSFSFAK